MLMRSTGEATYVFHHSLPPVTRWSSCSRHWHNPSPMGQQSDCTVWWCFFTFYFCCTDCTLLHWGLELIINFDIHQCLLMSAWLWVKSYWILDVLMSARCIQHNYITMRLAVIWQRPCWYWPGAVVPTMFLVSDVKHSHLSSMHVAWHTRDTTLGGGWDSTPTSLYDCIHFY